MKSPTILLIALISFFSWYCKQQQKPSEENQKIEGLFANMGNLNHRSNNKE